MERITSAQPPPPCLVKHASQDSSDLAGSRMDFPHMYVYKPRRGIKRGEDSKETYKLPHRLIEKKRRDRINECIAQLKDLLPEHLKLTTLGHLEKAVVLELTLKHVKALTTLLEQQQQKIVALQSGMQVGEQTMPLQDSSEEMFRSGFHLCAREVLHFLTKQEDGQHVTPSHMISHLQKVAAEIMPETQGLRMERDSQKSLDAKDTSSSPPQPMSFEGHGKNCVPVIQRTYVQTGSEQSGSDTDTDSGYGGELEKLETKADRHYCSKEDELKYSFSDRIATIKQETDDPPAKRARAGSTEDNALSNKELLGIHSNLLGFSSHQPPLCLPFYLIPPSAAAYLPILEKCWYPASMPVLYPGLSNVSSTLSSVMNPEKHPPSLLISPGMGSPHTSQSSLDSPALRQALKQTSPLNLETKD
ncbi:class E basic helix-loop-helix protein 40 [Polypterus senegalus]